MRLICCKNKWDTYFIHTRPGYYTDEEIAKLLGINFDVYKQVVGNFSGFFSDSEGLYNFWSKDDCENAIVALNLLKK